MTKLEKLRNDYTLLCAELGHNQIQLEQTQANIARLKKQIANLVSQEERLARKTPQQPPQEPQSETTAPSSNPE